MNRDAHASGGVFKSQSGPASWARVTRIISVLVIVAGLIYTIRQLPVESGVLRLGAWVQGAGIWGPMVFGLTYIIAAVLFIPGSALTFTAGAVFGLLEGTAIVSVASTTAAALAFLIARYFARSAVEAKARTNRRFAAIDQAIATGGWKIIALLRLSPAVPYSAGNYLYGLTAIRFWPYVLTSWLAMLPGTFAYVYLGVIGAAGLTAGTGAQTQRTPLQWTLLIVGLLATIAVTVYVTRLARNAIRKQTQIINEADSLQPATMPQGWTMRTTILVIVAMLVMVLAVTACSKRGSLKNLFGPPAVKLGEAYKEKAGGPKVDHAVFDQLLKKHVSPGGWVDYAGLKNDAGQLDSYIAQLAKVTLDELGRDEKLAALINAYNAFTLRLILDNYPLASIKDIPDTKRWDAVRWNLGGQTFSLNQMEHEQIRPKFKEPRIHFALVCAAIGCPPLRAEAYAASRIEEQLADQAVYVNTNDRWLKFDPAANRLQLTSLYKWYGSDFEQVAGSVVNFAAKYSPPVKASLNAGHQPKVDFLDYNWKLNAKENMQ